MKIKYFPDTDTAHLEFTDRNIHETKEISENIYIEFTAPLTFISTSQNHQ